ncbi:MAG: hypothetical protein KME57_05000 [Scytonema hyalinum WJT4-NPBG1]|nr:hypothetical protein [Scytonema hyalinum WJT4-NPBG1]
MCLPLQRQFDCGSGELFVVYLAGNFVNTNSLAGSQYAIEFLSVRSQLL